MNTMKSTFDSRSSLNFKEGEMKLRASLKKLHIKSMSSDFGNNL